MYVKPRKQLRDLYVPENYHGTAFAESKEQAQDAVPNSAPDPTSDMPEQEAPGELPVQAQNTPSSLLSGFNGLRSDDLLLLSLILLLSRSESEQGAHASGEILPLLALLLFMG